jgi:hypothetical protein
VVAGIRLVLVAVAALESPVGAGDLRAAQPGRLFELPELGFDE